MEYTDPHTVADALANASLRVRPPAEPVPAALVGTEAGEVFALLVRMNDGDFHARHRPMVVAAIARWDASALAYAARAAALSLWSRVGVNEWLSHVPVQAIARLAGVPNEALDRTVRAVHDFTRAIAPGAAAEAIAAGSAAARELMEQGETLGLDRVQSANRIALMQQSLDATAALIGNTLAALQQRGGAAVTREFVAEVARSDPAVVFTRRFAADGAALTLRIGDAGCPFGAGAHRCPGEHVALEIAYQAIDAVPWRTRDWTPLSVRPLPNVRIPIFQER